MADLPGGEVVDLFLQRVESLRGLTLAKTGIQYGMNFRWTEEGGANYEFRGPDEESFMALLMALRHFVAEGEPTFYPRIHGLVFPALQDFQLREHMMANRRHWLESLGELGVAYYVDNLRITPELAWDAMLNGKYFHNDPEKRTFIDGLAPDQHALVKERVYDYADGVMRIVNCTRNIIKKALEDGSLTL